MAEEKTLVLHDGEDENKTEELHKFLEGIEWDGDESGIDIWIHVDIGDTIVRGEDGSIAVRKRKQ